jgi:CMP-N-acetylneuraminic acid synthetase
MAKLKEIACSHDSALWQSASEQLIACAKEAMLETDSQFYLSVASACIGCSVSLARQERLASKTV